MRRVLPSRTVPKLASFASQVLAGVLVTLVASTLLNGMHVPTRTAGEPGAKFSARVPGAANASPAQEVAARPFVPLATFAFIEPPLPPTEHVAQTHAEPATTKSRPRAIANASPPARPKDLGTTKDMSAEPTAIEAAPAPQRRRFSLSEATALSGAAFDFSRLAPSSETMASAVSIVKSAFDWVSGDARR